MLKCSSIKNNNNNKIKDEKDCVKYVGFFRIIYKCRIFFNSIIINYILFLSYMLKIIGCAIFHLNAF